MNNTIKPDLIIKKLYINERLFIIYDDLTIYQLLIYFHYDPTSCIIEWNHKLISQYQMKNLLVQSGDNLEFLTIAGGG